LTWLGLGWAVGHGCELVALLAARQIGDTRLCVLWVPLALGIAFLRRRTWHRRFVPLRHPGPVMGAFVFVCLIGAALFFGYNAPTSGVQVYKVSDMWFHISNAHAFRDSSSNPDPRVAGITLNYHMFDYAPSAAASAVTGESIANLLSCYAGLNMVFLTTLLLFNVGRVLSHGRDLVGVLSALLLLLPLDVMALFTRWWSFGTGVFIFATYNSPPTLAGYMALLALLLPVYWQYGQHRWQDGWVVTLLAFFGAGAKGVVGPLLVCAAGAVVVWQLIFGRHLIGRALRLVILMLVPIPLITLPLAFGSRNSVSSLVLRNNSFAAQLPYYNTLIALHWPDGIARGVWIFGFAFLYLLCAALGTWRQRKNRRTTPFFVFVWAFFLAGVIPGTCFYIFGDNQIYFVWYGLVALTSIAGYGLFALCAWLGRHPRVFGLSIVAIVLVYALVPGIDPIQPVAANYRESLANAHFHLMRTAVFDAQSDTQLRNESQKCNPQPDAGACSYTFLTEDIRNGLAWARSSLPKDAVFAVNAYNAGVYGSYTERQAFFESVQWTAEGQSGDPNMLKDHFGARFTLITDWRAGNLDVPARMRQAGISYLYIDRVNGFAVPTYPDLSPPIFERPDFAIYRL